MGERCFATESIDVLPRSHEQLGSVRGSNPEQLRSSAFIAALDPAARRDLLRILHVLRARAAPM